MYVHMFPRVYDGTLPGHIPFNDTHKPTSLNNPLSVAFTIKLRRYLYKNSISTIRDYTQPWKLLLTTNSTYLYGLRSPAMSLLSERQKEELWVCLILKTRE